MTRTPTRTRSLSKRTSRTPRPTASTTAPGTACRRWARASSRWSFETARDSRSFPRSSSMHQPTTRLATFLTSICQVVRHARVLVCTMAAGILPCSVLRAQVCSTELVSLGISGGSGDGPSINALISADASVICFSSKAQNLVASDINPQPNSDAFLFDRASQTTVLLNVSSSGVQGIGDSAPRAVSWDGRLALFVSTVPSLVVGDTNGKADYFVRDLVLGTTTRVNLSETGQELNDHSNSGDMSLDGRVMFFATVATNVMLADQTPWSDVFVRDLETGSVDLVSVSSTGQPGDASSAGPRCSADGRFVLFLSWARNLDPKDTNFAPDAYVRDIKTGVTECVSLTLLGTAAGGGPDDISVDGRFVTWNSSIANIVPGDTNNQNDVFVTDRWLHVTERVSVSSTGAQGNSGSTTSAISADGRFVAFESFASNLVPGDTLGWDIFVRDRLLHTTTLVSQSTAGVKGDWESNLPAISADGRSIVFESLAHTLSSVPLLGAPNIFVRTCTPPGPETYCPAKLNSQGCLPQIRCQGTPDASAPSGFVVRAEQVLGQKLGFLVYGLSGSNTIPFGGGYLCVSGPFRRVASQVSSGGAAGCAGGLAFDFNLFAASGVDPALVSGQDVWCQWWSRDGGFAPPNSISLTNALHFAFP
ncbi:MAG: PD40 domain-containing protein [Planctomycetes bacterium]|nr:PD40 domain-containing protein [Planctomycetota bacterium]